MSHQPESTYIGRSTAAQPVDLASYHTTQTTRCSDCRSGQGLSGRMTAEVLGALNALKWYTGTAVQPALLASPIGEVNCLKYHQSVTHRGYYAKEQITILDGLSVEREGGDEASTGHWHVFLTRWQAADSKAASCATCHSAPPKADLWMERPSNESARPATRCCGTINGFNGIKQMP